MPGCLNGASLRQALRMCKLFECYLDNVDFEEDESLVFFNGDGDPMPHSRPALYMILVEHDISRTRY